jgi:hypothetical protein
MPLDKPEGRERDNPNPLTLATPANQGAANPDQESLLLLLERARSRSARAFSTPPIHGAVNPPPTLGEHGAVDGRLSTPTREYLAAILTEAISMLTKSDVAGSGDNDCNDDDQK